MREFYPIIFATIAILLVGLIEILLLAALNRPWWRKKAIRRASWMLPLFGVIMVVLWGIGEYNAKNWLAYPAAITAVLIFVLEVALMLSLPLSGVIHLAGWAVEKIVRSRRRREPARVDTHRRLFLQGLAAAVPLGTLTMSAAGVARAFTGVNVHRLPFEFEGLPTGLEGFRILHLPDIHLRNWVNLEYLSDVLIEAETHRPDLVLVTGDIADDVSVLAEALDMIAGLRPRFGSFACLGNHEYFRGINKIRRIFDGSPIPLLVNRALDLDVAGHRLRVGGTDDPRSMRGSHEDFFSNAINQTLPENTNPDLFVLMSHRPDALDYASTVGIDLVLSGHTHGGQIGLFGRSVFEPVWPRMYLWGRYRRGGTQLYTSAGVGHWMPFRLGCPPEAPVIELRQG